MTKLLQPERLWAKAAKPCLPEGRHSGATGKSYGFASALKAGIVGIAVEQSFDVLVPACVEPIHNDRHFVEPIHHHQPGPIASSLGAPQQVSV